MCGARVATASAVRDARDMKARNASARQRSRRARAAAAPRRAAPRHATPRRAAAPRRAAPRPRRTRVRAHGPLHGLGCSAACYQWIQHRFRCARIQPDIPAIIRRGEYRGDIPRIYRGYQNIGWKYRADTRISG